LYHLVMKKGESDRDCLKLRFYGSQRRHRIQYA